MLQFIRQDVQLLSDSLNEYKEEQYKKICVTIDLFKSVLDGAVVSIQQKQSVLEKTCEGLRDNQDFMKQEIVRIKNEEKMHWETTQELKRSYRELENRSSFVQKDLEKLTSIANSSSSCEDYNQPVFDAPVRNKWFVGRENELERIEECLSSDEIGRLKMCALCGLGGCGKTALATHLSWKRKAKYEGGVFWFSLEDDKKFENSVTELALRLGIVANSFDLTLSRILTWISGRKKPWLLVLDDVDQLVLSEQMHKVLSGMWKRQAGGHVLLTTRREPKEVCEAIDLEPTCCFEISALPKNDAKQFLISRCGETAEEREDQLDELLQELGCLPLALEQAGAHIKALECSISNYLQEYKVQRLNLLSQHPRSKPAWDYESKSRLAVHTTWLMNFEYVKTSPHGPMASRFMHIAAFLEPTEIPEELIIPPLLSVDDPSCKNSYLPLIKNHIAEILTKFSLFQRKSTKFLSLHRLVQEVIRNRMTVEEVALSLHGAVKILHQSFLDCPSPDQIILDVTKRVKKQPSSVVTNPSRFHLWSRLTSHASEVQQHVKTFLNQQGIGRDVKLMILTPETSRIVYEDAVKLSVYGHQEKAKETEHFAFQIMDSNHYEIRKDVFSIRNASLVAISNNAAVTLASNSLLVIGICDFQNLSFQSKVSVVVHPHASVEINHCTFQSTSTDQPAVIVKGKAVLLECKIKDSKGGGIGVCGSSAFATLIKCHVSGNGSKPTFSAGIKVLEQGRLAVQECFIYGNTEGIHLDGTRLEGVLAKEAKVTRCDIYDNRYEGIIVAGHPDKTSDVVDIQENKIYHNGGFGVRVSYCANRVLFQRNMVFENYWWGVWVQCNSGGYYEGNTICNNKMGGLRVGKQSPGKLSCVIENNVIHDNCGPAFHEGLRYFEFYSFPSELKPLFVNQLLDGLKKLYGGDEMQDRSGGELQRNLVIDIEMSIPNVVKCKFISSNRCFQNCRNQNQSKSTESNISCAYCFRSNLPLKTCQRCMTAKYCGKGCQKLHWGRHKYMCEAAGHRNVIEVSFSFDTPYSMLSSTHPGLEPTGPAYASPPSRNGSRFIVKMQTFEGLIENGTCLDGNGYVSDDYNPEKARITIYDRSRYVDFMVVNQPRLFHLIIGLLWDLKSP